MDDFHDVERDSLDVTAFPALEELPTNSLDDFHEDLVVATEGRLLEDLLVKESLVAHVGEDGTNGDAAVGTDVNEGATDGEDDPAHTRAFDDLLVSREYSDKFVGRLTLDDLLLFDVDIDTDGEAGNTSLDDLLVEVGVDGADVTVGADVERATDGEGTRFHTIRAFDDLELSRPWKNR